MGSCSNTLIFLSAWIRPPMQPLQRGSPPPLAPRAYLQGQLLDVSEQLDVLLRQVLVSGQLLVLVAPVAAFLIV